MEGDELDAMRDMFGEDFALLAGLYLRDSPPRVAALQHAADSGDAAQAATVVHSLGGSCASIGATGLASLCMTLDHDCRRGNHASLAAQAAAIATEYARIAARLQAMLAEPQA